MAKNRVKSVLDDVSKAWESKGVRYATYAIGGAVLAKLAYGAYGRYKLKAWKQKTRQDKDGADAVAHTVNGIYGRAILAGLNEFSKNFPND